MEGLREGRRGGGRVGTRTTPYMHHVTHSSDSLVLFCFVLVSSVAFFAFFSFFIIFFFLS